MNEIERYKSPLRQTSTAYKKDEAKEQEKSTQSDENDGDDNASDDESWKYLPIIIRPFKISSQSIWKSLEKLDTCTFDFGAKSPTHKKRS